jgi:hypothetical protein
MSVVRLKHVDLFTGPPRSRALRLQAREGQADGIAGRPGTEEFMLAYQAALAGEEVCKPVEIAAGRVASCTLERDRTGAPGLQDDVLGAVPADVDDRDPWLARVRLRVLKCLGQGP